MARRKFKGGKLQRGASMCASRRATNSEVPFPRSDGRLWNFQGKGQASQVIDGIRAGAVDGPVALSPMLQPYLAPVAKGPDEASPRCQPDIGLKSSGLNQRVQPVLIV